VSPARAISRWWPVLTLAAMFSCQPFDPLHPYDKPPPPDTSVTWEKTIGGPGEDVACSVLEASDGGFVIAGYTDAADTGNFDAWLIKTDSSGATQWSKTFGGAAEDRAYSVTQASDGGYVLVGNTFSSGAGGSDIYLVKTDAEGGESWHRTYGTSANEIGWCVVRTSDGGYAIAGSTSDNGVDAVLIKTDADGAPQWQKQYGSSGFEQPECLRQTPDGGFIVTGSAEGTAGVEDVYLLKVDKDGNEQLGWPKRFGLEYPDRGMAVEPTADGGYAVAGYTRSYGAGDFNAWLIKTDGTGAAVWSKTFGGDDYDLAQGAHVAPDGGFVLCGMTQSYEGWKQAWLIRTAQDGSLLWTRTFGGPGNEWAKSVELTSDGGYLVVGTTTTVQGGNVDAYLVYYKP
jgi:hypothetical protein